MNYSRCALNSKVLITNAAILNRCFDEALFNGTGNGQGSASDPYGSVRYLFNWLNPDHDPEYGFASGEQFKTIQNSKIHKNAAFRANSDSRSKNV
jgi:hypothetical protein